MPTRKQRRRRDKAFRHEYELVSVDEDGNEVPVDHEALRAERAERRSHAKPTPAKGSGKGRSLRVPPEPSWQRSLKRGGLWGAAIFVVFVFVLRNGPIETRVGIGVVYGLIFVPLTYWIDRMSYRMYLKRAARGEERSESRKNGRGGKR